MMVKSGLEKKKKKLNSSMWGKMPKITNSVIKITVFPHGRISN